MNPIHIAHCIGTGIGLIYVTYRRQRKLSHENKALKAYLAKQHEAILYIADMADRQGVEIEEFDQIVLKNLLEIEEKP